MVVDLARVLKVGDGNERNGLLLVVCLYIHLSDTNLLNWNEKQISDNLLEKLLQLTFNELT